nr:DUF393 domain-containing protein [Allomuricauda sp.]
MERSTIIFDGECNLCNGVIGKLVQYAPKDQFDMVPFQSPYGQELLKNRGMETGQLETVVLIDEAGTHTLSTGFLRILASIPAWRWAVVLVESIPRPLRDYIYRIAATNRVRWFGKSQACAVSL